MASGTVADHRRLYEKAQYENKQLHEPEIPEKAVPLVPVVWLAHDTVTAVSGRKGGRAGQYPKATSAGGQSGHEAMPKRLAEVVSTTVSAAGTLMKICRKVPPPPPAVLTTSDFAAQNREEPDAH
jgi:hypothetical protein